MDGDTEVFTVVMDIRVIMGLDTDALMAVVMEVTDMVMVSMGDMEGGIIHPDHLMLPMVFTEMEYLIQDVALVKDLMEVLI